MTAQEAAFHTFLFPQLLPPRLSAEDALGWLVRLYRPALPSSLPQQGSRHSSNHEDTEDGGAPLLGQLSRSSAPPICS